MSSMSAHAGPCGHSGCPGHEDGASAIALRSLPLSQGLVMRFLTAVLLPLLAALELTSATSARAAEKKAEGLTPALLQEPVAFRVYQRDRADRADIPVTLAPGLSKA